jgi:hypothetical protein
MKHLKKKTYKHKLTNSKKKLIDYNLNKLNSSE